MHGERDAQAALQHLEGDRLIYKSSGSEAPETKGVSQSEEIYDEQHQGSPPLDSLLFTLHMSP